jgi:hypothetical protein
MEAEKRVLEWPDDNDEIPDPEEEMTPPRDDVTDAVREAAKRRLVPADEDVPNDCINEKML